MPFSLNVFANTAHSKQAMVVSAQHLASQVGLSILKQGGNAIDAAVAMGYALAVVYPAAGNLGGGGFMLIHLSSNKNIFINFRETAPAKISANLLLNAKGQSKITNAHIDAAKSKSAYLSVGVPGTVKGLNTALLLYGSLPLKTVMQPAINFAKNGFKLNQQDVKFLNYGLKSFHQSTNVGKIFLNNGKAYSAGETLKQINLAHSLELIANQGDYAFYQGAIAQKIATAMQKHGGVMTLSDLKRYNVDIEKPLVCHYQGYTIYTAAPPSGGGVTLCQVLNIVNAYPLTKLGLYNATAIHDNIEAMRYAFADRKQYLGDPDFVNMPISYLLSAKYANSIRQKIKPKTAGHSASIQFFKNNEKPETTSYAVVDSKGNAVSVTYTLNGYYGARIIAGNTGFFLNNELDLLRLRVSLQRF
jgi:gamma-glutamyltranspeptidase/glutathione hydrolase